MKKILVTGGNGQLGNSLRRISKDNTDYEFVFTDFHHLDITSQEALGSYLDSHDGIYAIINCAAYTAVDQAETDIEKAREINSVGPLNLALETEKRDIGLIHISTDYVFDNSHNTPIHPLDTGTIPNSIYGITKLEGEENIKHNSTSYIIIRTAWLYSEYGNNFVKTMIRIGAERDSLNVVYDQIGSPTYAIDLAKAIIDALDYLQPDTEEVLHYTNEGVCSWYDFAKKIMELRNIECIINPIVSQQYSAAAPRPSYSVLDNQPIKDYLSITIPHWEDSLKECLKRIK